ncbi:MAG: murein biosynthesis integral membrane protein MurJ [Xanthomonadales bacterium]|nr:murein biosynthesis integral membrane protein MurJ [Xanthomonadales bacterium]
MKLLRSTLVFSSLTFLSRLSGYARDMVQAIVFGATGLTDAFVVAYRIPNFLRRIFAEGAFAQAFVPVLSAARQEGDRAALKLLLDRVAGTLCAVVLVVTGLGMIAAPALVTVFAPGYLDDPVRHSAASDMLRITFPYLFFISMTAMAGGVLNSFNRFAIPALTPILHNLAIIAAALWLAPLLSVPVMALAWGVFAAGAIQMLVQVPALARLGLLPRPRWRPADPGVRRILRLMGPAVLSASAAQINLLVGTAFASLLIAGSQTWLYMADRLLEFPIGMIGVALGTVLLPTLSRRQAAGDDAGYRQSLDWGVRLVLIIALPAATGLIVLAEPICATLYQHGRFTEQDTAMTALALVALCLGLPGFMLSKVLAPAFFARQDTATPMRAALIVVAVNLVLVTALVLPLRAAGATGTHAAIALSTGICGLLHAGLLAFWLHRRQLYRPAAGSLGFLSLIVLACMAMAALLWAGREWLGPWAQLPPVSRLLHLGWLIPAAVAAYVAVLLAAGMRWRHLREPPTA